LGRISFGLYLIHVPIAYTLVMAVAVLLWPMSAITLVVGLLIFVALSVSLGWLMTALVDGPALRVLASIRALKNKWRSPLATVRPLVLD
jgi:peptidoglycan/LPS O-acetylase OafA/YrhL